MRPISGMLPGTIYATAAANKVKESPAVQNPIPETEERAAAPRVDEYKPDHTVRALLDGQGCGRQSQNPI